MGSGKSSVGRKVAEISGVRFVDTDELVAESENATISEIFSICGEEYFRQREQEALGRLTSQTGLLVSTGGGIVLREQNRELLRKLGVVVWIDAEPDVLFERATRSGRRPLLKVDDPRQRFDDLLKQRLALYQETCHFRIDSTRLSHEAAAEQILRLAENAEHIFGC